jgi:hypothetical protein
MGLGFLAEVKRAEREAEDIYKISLDRAHAAILEAAPVASLIQEYEIDLSAELARIMRELDRACRGDSISTTAVLTACSHMQEKLLRYSKHSEGIDK